LIQSAIEEKGIPTVSVSVAEEITTKVGAPRVLFTPYAFGYPLGEPGNADLQHRIIREALGLLDRDGPPPVNAHFDPGAA
jgi:hypothetical protein